MKPKSTHRAPLAHYVWRHLVAAFALLPAVTVTVITTGTIGTGAALADVACRPGSWTPSCATQKTVPQNPALSALTCLPGSSMPGCTTQRPTAPTPAPEPDPPAVTALTASFHGLPDAHDGKKLFTFELRFSEEFAGLRLGMVKRTLEVTNGRLVGVKRTVRGQNRSMTVKVRPSSSGEVTVELPQVGWFWSAASATVSGPSAPSALSALTASFHGLPDAHDGKKLFSFEIRFSEEFDGMTLTALKRALEVTGGRLIDVKRTVRGQNRRVTVRVRPSSHDPVTVTLGATTDCSAAGAICAQDGRQLSAAATASVFSPAWGGSTARSVSANTLRELSENRLRLPKSVVQHPISSSAPTGLPSEAGTVVNMNTFGSSWTGKADVVVRERYVRGGSVAINFPCRSDVTRESETNPGTTVIVGGILTKCRIGGSLASYPDTLEIWDPLNRVRVPVSGGVDVYGRWFSYPANAGTNDMKVHLEVLRGTYPGEGKNALADFFKQGHDLEWFLNYVDFFKAEAHLEAPGTAVQPTLAVNTTATWTGKVIALDTARYGDHSNNPNFARRGQLIGGDATITVQRLSTPVLGASVALTNLKGTNAAFSSYPNLNWNNMVINLGNFGRTVRNHPDELLPNSTISGTFRGTGAAKVGGTFEVPSFYYWQYGAHVGMVGGFVADKD